jgi:hypothetical protein
MSNDSAQRLKMAAVAENDNAVRAEYDRSAALI